MQRLKSRHDENVKIRSASDVSKASKLLIALRFEFITFGGLLLSTGWTLASRDPNYHLLLDLLGDCLREWQSYFVSSTNPRQKTCIVKCVKQ
jgi:hypothetical protein